MCNEAERWRCCSVLQLQTSGYGGYGAGGGFQGAGGRGGAGGYQGGGGRGGRGGY